MMIWFTVLFAECPKGHPYYIGDVSSTHLLFTSTPYQSSRFLSETLPSMTQAQRTRIVLHRIHAFNKGIPSFHC